jgi:Bacterial Ig-like domain (group 3)
MISTSRPLRLVATIGLGLALAVGQAGGLGPQSQSVHAQSTVTNKPVPGPQAPIAAPRHITRPAGTSADGKVQPGLGYASINLNRALHNQATLPIVGAAKTTTATTSVPIKHLPATGRVVEPSTSASGTALNRAAFWQNGHWVFSTALHGPVLKPLGVPFVSSPKAMSSGGASPSAIGSSAQADVNPNGCAINETTIAQSTANPSILVAGANTYIADTSLNCGDSHAWSFFSFDGGHTWQDSKLHQLEGAAGDPAVTYNAAFDKFIYSYLDFTRNDTGSTNSRVGVETSADGGQSWGQNTSLDGFNAGYGVDKDMITTNNTPGTPHYGRTVVSWTEFQSGGQLFFEDYTDDGGATWHSPGVSINFNNDACGNGTSPAFDHNGELMVAWQSCTGGSDHLREELSPDGGQSWPASSDTNIVDFTAIDNGGCQLDTVASGTAFRCNSFPSVAGDPTTSVSAQSFLVVWANELGGNAKITGIDTSDGGASWGHYQYISFNDAGDKFFPWLKFASNGRFDVGYSNREDALNGGNTPNGTTYDEWYTESDSLASYNAVSYVTGQVDTTQSNPGGSTFIGDYSGMADDDFSFDAYPVWTDLRSGENAQTADLCYLDCYRYLTPGSIIDAGSASFTDFYQINTLPAAFGGAGGDFWNAVGIREGSDGTSVDDDMFLAPNRYFNSTLASSSDSPPFNDYLLVNGNSGHAPSSTYFTQVHSFSSFGGPYAIEWAAGHIVLGTSFHDDTTFDVLRVYDAFLNTGTLYYVGLRPDLFNSSNFSLTIHSASLGAEQGRGSRVSDSGPTPPGQPAFASYNTGADPLQFDGVVVVNNNFGNGGYTLYKDTAVPTGTISVNAGATYTTSAAVTLTLSATNPTAGDPVSDMRFSDDNVTFGAWVPYATSASHTLTAGDGAKTVFVQFRNGAGGVSATASDGITLDTTAPHTTATLTGTLSGTSYFSPVTVTLNATDATSGVASTHYTLDGGASTLYAGPFNVTAIGAHTVVFFSKDNAGNTEANQSVSFTIIKTPTTASIVSSSLHSLVGQNVTFTVTIAPSTGPAETGIVIFKDGVTTLANVALNASRQAVYSTSTLTQGAHQIKGIYVGDSNYVTSTSPIITQLVQKTTTTALTSSANPSVFGQSVTFSASITPNAGPVPTGSVTFKDGATTLGTGVVNGSGVATFTTSSLSVATHSITAAYGGDNNYVSSTSGTVFQVVKKANTSVAVTSSVNPSVHGQSVTFTATVSAVAPGAGTRTGTVFFRDGATTLGTGAVNASGVATLSFSTLAVGAHNITAYYAGDANFNTNTSPIVVQTVNKAATSTSLTSSVNPSAHGQSVTFTATVNALAPGAGTRTGTVTFMDGATTLGTGAVNVSGVATFSTTSLAQGSHSITAVYGGDVNYTGSTSSVLTQTVNAAVSTTVVVTSGSPSVFGQLVTFTATISPHSGPVPTGTVTFKDGATVLGTGAVNGSGVATFSTSSLTVANHTITAVYGGDANFLGSTSAGIFQTVNKAATTTVVVSSLNPSLHGQSVMFTATVSPTAPGAGTRTGTVFFRDGASTLGTGVVNASGVATFSTSSLAVGSHSITAYYAGDGNFNASTSAVLTQTVN